MTFGSNLLRVAGLVGYLVNLHSVHVSSSCYQIRLTDIDDAGPYVYTSGHSSYDGRRIKMVAPKKKNRTFGVGSIEDVPMASSIAPRSTQDNEETVRLRRELDQTNTQLATMTDMFQIIIVDSPLLVNALQEREWLRIKQRFK
ncbi:unnamed protein product [Cochlearia groenlandica]